MVVVFKWLTGQSDPAANPVAEPLVVALASQSGSGESGRATLEEVDGQIKVTINLTGDPKDVAQPAHLHKGSCAALGEAVYTLIPVENGLSETVLTISRLALEDNLPLALNVHQSADAIDTYVACGDVAVEN